ncbi:MAG: efflux RND transporter periplasmic adaptor subunit [Rhizobacter sp.]|nr:efflux RND transporter periplasmic adaptor subunit [Burkholderiales bacterium]
MASLRFNLALSLLTTAGLLALSGCSEPVPPAPDAAAAVLQGNQLRYPAGHPQLALLTTVDVRPSTAVAIDLPARLTWNESRTQRIFPAFAGRVTAIRADVGQSVKAGSILALMASPDFGQAQADAARAAVDAQLTQKSLARQSELLAAGVIARREFETTEAEAARAQTEVTRAQARSKLYGGGSGFNQQLGLITGINGIVVERNLNPGQELRPDQSGAGVPPPFVVSDPTSLWVQIDARERDVASLRAGSTFELIVPTLPNEKFVGKVVTSGDAIDPTTRTIKVRGEVANPDRRLKAEMLATARLERHLGGGLLIPASAVVLRGTQHTIYVQTGLGMFEPREVRISYQDSKQAVVARGLEAGDKVVSENVLLLERQFALSREAGAGKELASETAPKADTAMPATLATTATKSTGNAIPLSLAPRAATPDAAK